jgi:hypothetical protein
VSVPVGVGEFEGVMEAVPVPVPVFDIVEVTEIVGDEVGVHCIVQVVPERVPPFGQVYIGVAL